MSELDVIEIDRRELARLHSVERAWETVFCVLKAGNHECFNTLGTGIECAVREINRLQLLERNGPS